MKTTLEIPDELFRHAKATAAMRGESLKELVTAALTRHLELQGVAESAPAGWRAVFGRAGAAEVREVDSVIAEDLERIDPDDWR